MKKAQTSGHSTRGYVQKFILCCVIWWFCPVNLIAGYVPLSQIYKPLMSTSRWHLNRIILTVAYLLQILSPWGHRSEKKTALKILPSFFSFSNSPCRTEVLLNLSVHIPFDHCLCLLRHVGSSCSLLLPLCLCAPPPSLCLGGRYWRTLWQRDQGHEVLIVNVWVFVCLCEADREKSTEIREWEMSLKKKRP